MSRRNASVRRAVYGAATAQSLLPFLSSIPAEDKSAAASKGQETDLSFSAEVSWPNVCLWHLLSHPSSPFDPARDLARVLAGFCVLPALLRAPLNLSHQSQRPLGPVQTPGAQPGSALPLARPLEALHLPCKLSFLLQAGLHL